MNTIVALREVRECLESLGEMLSHAGAEGGGPFSQWSNDELRGELEQCGEKLTEIVIRYCCPQRGQRLGCAQTQLQRLFLFGKLSGLNDKDAALARIR